MQAGHRYEPSLGGWAPGECVRWSRVSEGTERRPAPGIDRCTNSFPLPLPGHADRWQVAMPGRCGRIVRAFEWRGDSGMPTSVWSLRCGRQAPRGSAWGCLG